MKKLFLYIILLLSVLSCREKMESSVTESSAIAFATPTVSETKSGLIAEVDDMVIGVENGKNILGYGVYASKYIPGEDGGMVFHQMFMDNLRVYSRDGSTWGYDGDSFYWSIGAVHKLFAVYPYYDNGSDDYDLGISYGINSELHALQVTGKHEYTDAKGNTSYYICTGFEPDGTPLCPDILYDVIKYSEPYQVGEDRAPVSFVFNHALSAVSFKFRNVSEYPIISIQPLSGDSKILLDGFKNVSEYVLLKESGPDWATPTEVDGHEFVLTEFDYDAENNNAIDPGAYYTAPGSEYWYTALMIPQNFAGYPDSPSLSFAVTFDQRTSSSEQITPANTLKKEYTINFKDYIVHNSAENAYSFLSGHHYEYGINVSASMVSCDVAIVPWIEDDPIILN